MKAKSQAIYEELCKALRDTEIDKCYCLAVMGMNRTLCLCPRLSRFDRLQDLNLLYGFMHENMREVCEHRQTYKGYDAIRSFFDNLSDQEDEYIYFNPEDTKEETSLKSGLYEFLETWFAFLGLLINSLEKYTPEKMVSFITLPVRYLDAYLLNDYYKSIDEGQLQDFVNVHPLLTNEAERIRLDCKQVLRSDHNSLYERVSLYSGIDILHENVGAPAMSARSSLEHDGDFSPSI
ncbi:MAG: hypothetical protein NC543_05890 [bacterium]|nr:hypothetical protein [bacterium]MCM1374500.1 hypothetical protein [Muribaculum sp.]